MVAKRLECARIPPLFFEDGSQSSATPLSNQERRDTAHSKRFARFGCGFATSQAFPLFLESAL